VEFFQLLGWTQFLEHQRPQCTWADLRSIDAMERVVGAFDQTMHTVDVRPPRQQDGWHNLRNIGFFLWRLHDHPLVHAPAPPPHVACLSYSSPLGTRARLFSRLQDEPDTLVKEFDVPPPIRRTLFDKDLHDSAHPPPLPPPPAFPRFYGAFSVDPADPA